MNNKEKIKIAEQEVAQAKLMIKISQEDLDKWEALLDLRTDTLNRLKSAK